MKKITRRVGVSIAILAVAALALDPVSARPASLCPMLDEPGDMVAWGSPTDLLVPLMPLSDTFVALSDGGSRQTLAIRTDGTLYVNPDPDAMPDVPEDLAGLEFCGVGGGRDHGIGLLPGGRIRVWPEAAAEGAPRYGGFTAVTGAGAFFSLALHRTGSLVTWGVPGLPGMTPPSSTRFRAIAARGRYALALSEDGNVYGWGTDAVIPGVVGAVFAATWKSDNAGHYIAPSVPGNPYTAIAAGLDVVVALRTDGSIVVWDSNPSDPRGALPDPPEGVVFVKIATGNGFVAAIDDTGRLHAWGRPALTWVRNVPAGRYSAVSAATSHIAAIKIPNL